MKETLTQSPTWFRAALATTFTAFAGWQLWVLGFGEPVLVAKAGLLKDDAFFYSVLVDNLQKHGFFTLDGEMHTNGFQPLWMFVLLALKSALPSVDALRLLQGMSWASWLLFSWGAIWLLSRGTPFGATVRSLIVGGLLINNNRVQDMLVVGLEVPLALALIVWALVYVESLSQKTYDEHTLGVGAGAALGALAGLIFLARTDLFWLAPTLGLWAFVRSGRAWKPLLAFGVVVAAIVLPYLSWNVLMHGDLMPISGRVKLYFMQTFYPTWDAYWASDEWHGLPRLFERALPNMPWKTTVRVSAGLLVLANAVTWSRWGRRELPDAFRILGVAVTAHAIYMHVGYRELRPYTSYYFAPELLFLVAVLAWWISAIRGRVAVVAVMVLVLVTSNGRWDIKKLKPNGYWSSRIELAQELPQFTGGARAGAFWPGAFASFSGLDVVPLDGVIGSQEFFNDYVKTGKEIDYLRERGIRWVVVSAPRPGAVTGDKKPKVREWSGLGRIRLWEVRDDLRHANSRGGWHIFELTTAEHE